MAGCSQTHINLDVKPGPFFFHGFLRPVSRAREIENDAFHGLFIQFHGHFTGYFLNFTTFSYSGKPGLVRHWPETYYTRAVLLGLIIDCYRI